MLKNLPLISFSAIKSQLSKIWKAIAVGILISLGGAGLAVLIAKMTGNPIWILVKDAAEIKYFPPYVGMLSNLGVILWMAAAVICLFSAVILKQQKTSDATFRFMAASGIFSLCLGLDDLYLLHDHLFPRLFHISELFFYVIYFFILLFYLIYFIPQILKHEYLLFGASLLFFLLSRRMFVALPFLDQFMTARDMLKYFGISFWLVFFYRTGLYELGTLINREKQL